MGNALIAYPNRTDQAVLSGGSWTAGLPLTNLQTRKIKQVARSTNANNSSTKFDVALDKARKITLLGFVNHNLSLDATYRVRAYSDAGYTTLEYDSGVLPVWPSVYNTEDLEWEDDNFWTGQFTEEEIEDFVWTLPHLVTEFVYVRYWRIEFFDSTNAAGYVQIGRLFIANGWSPVTNMSYGAGLTYEDDTVVDKALSGAEYFDERLPYRVAMFNLEFMEEDEGMTKAFDIQLRQGIKEEVFYMFDTEDTLHILRRTFLGRLQTLNPVEFPLPALTRSAFKIKELQ